MIVCNRCAKENQDHYKFCLGCGAELPAAAPPEQDVGMMKTMMADLGTGRTPTPPGGTPLTPPPVGSAPRQSPLPMGPPSASGPGMTPAPLSAPSAQPMAPPGALGAPPAAFRPSNPAPPLGAAPPMRAPSNLNPIAPAGPPPGVPTAATPSVSPPPGLESQPAAMPATTDACPNCRATVPPGFKFCGACGTRLDAAPPRQTADFADQPAAQPSPRGLLTLIRPDGSEGGTHELSEGENEIGRQVGGVFGNDGYLSPTHAEIVLNAAGAVVRDLDSLNGVFARMHEEEQILPGQVIRIGQELLRFDVIEPPEPLEDGTEVMGSPNPGYWGKLTVIIGNDVDGSAYPLLGDSVTIGRERGDINFPDDGYVSGLHARLFMRDGNVLLADLGSSNGTFVKIQGEREISEGSYILLGQQLFRLNITK